MNQFHEISFWILKNMWIWLILFPNIFFFLVLDILNFLAFCEKAKLSHCEFCTFLDLGD